MTNQAGRLYLIPNFLGEGSREEIPQAQLKVIYDIHEFIVESEKQARLFLKTIGHPTPQSDFLFYFLNEHTNNSLELPEWFNNCLQGKNIGLLSDAGIPCLADPGNKAVSFAHSQNIKVVPLSGPSSIYMALMASGFNGQQFTFHGYLPVEPKIREKKLKDLEQLVNQSGYSQIFIETPYRNKTIFETMLKVFKPTTELCVAFNITQADELIETKTVKAWQKAGLELSKKPAVFIIGRSF